MSNFFEHLPINKYPFIWSDFIELYVLSIPGGHCDEKQFLKLIDTLGTEKPKSPETLWLQLLGHCSERMKLYSGYYPFDVSLEEKSITLKLIRTHPKQRLYLSMAIAASINYLPKDWNLSIAQDFSITCRQIFSCLMPEGTNLEHITTASTSSLTTEQIQSLVHLACGEITDKNDKRLAFLEKSAQSFSAKNDIAPTSQIDVLAWHPIGDGHDGIPIAVARFDYSVESWQNGLPSLEGQIYAQHAPWAAYHFSPIDLYTAKQDWGTPTQPLGRMILLDRYRILTLAEEFFIYNDIPEIEHIERLYQHIKM